jgi:hypothetical protein
MARLDLTTLTQNLNALSVSMNEVLNALLTDANDQRKELLSLHTRMAENRADLAEVAGLAYQFADIMELVGARCEDVAGKAKDAVETGDIPTVDYEHFMGWCDVCGAEVTADTDWAVLDEDHVLLCADCNHAANETDTEPADEATE